MSYKIPKIIHYVWVGGSEKPKSVKRCIASWKKHCPNYEIKEWNETNFDINSNEFVKGAYEQKKWAFVSDYVRVWAIYKYGGIYLDSDCIVLQNLNELRKDRAFIGFESNDIMLTACFGAEKKHPLIKSMLDCYSGGRKFKYDPLIASRSLYDKDYFPINVHEATRILANGYKAKLGGEEQDLKDGIHIYPARILCEPSLDSKVIHIFTATWGDWHRGVIDRAMLMAKSHIKSRLEAGLYLAIKSMLSFAKHPARSIDDRKLQHMSRKGRTAAIMTFYSYNNNYGSILQEYAMSKVLASLGVKAVFVDYYPSRPDKMLRHRLALAAFSILRRFWKGIRRTNAENLRFKRKYFENTRSFYGESSLALLPQVFDYYIAGSDQIWASHVLDNAFLLSMIASPNKVSYAASAVVLNYSDEQKEAFKRELPKFGAISVREHIGKKELSNYTDQDIAVTLDPTLLLKKEQYHEIMSKNNPFDGEKYLLCFYLPSQKSYKKITEETAKRLNVNIVNISECANNQFGKVMSGISVEMFLSLINDAELVMTNSYHGLLFSLIFEREFLVLSRHKGGESKNQNARYAELLDSLGLAERYISDEVVSTNLEQKLDYKRVNAILDKRRVDSIVFLQNALAKGNK